jgi:TolB-like protein
MIRPCLRHVCLVLTLLGAVAGGSLTGQSAGGSQQPGDLSGTAARIAEALSRNWSSGSAAEQPSRIAILSFTRLEGGIPVEGVQFAEELTTQMFLTRKFRVIERSLLDRLLVDHKLAQDGLVDPSSVNRLGEVANVEAIVTGSMASLGNRTRINARMISTRTGLVLGAASSTLWKPGQAPGMQVESASPESSAKEPTWGRFTLLDGPESLGGWSISQATTGKLLPGPKWDPSLGGIPVRMEVIGIDLPGIASRGDLILECLVKGKPTGLAVLLASSESDSFLVGLGPGMSQGVTQITTSGHINQVKTKSKVKYAFDEWHTYVISWWNTRVDVSIDGQSLPTSIVESTHTQVKSIGIFATDAVVKKVSYSSLPS